MAKKTPSTSSWGKATAAKRYAFGGITSAGASPEGGVIQSQQPNPQLRNLGAPPTLPGSPGMSRLLGEPPTSANPNMGGMGPPATLGGGAIPMGNFGRPETMGVPPPVAAPPPGSFGGHPGDMGIPEGRLQRRLDRRAARQDGEPNPRAVGVPFDGWNGRKHGGRVKKGKK
jgi:hypothetical protein